jgi:hypothetical protein
MADSGLPLLLPISLRPSFGTGQARPLRCAISKYTQSSNGRAACGEARRVQKPSHKSLGAAVLPQPEGSKMAITRLSTRCLVVLLVACGGKSSEIGVNRQTQAISCDAGIYDCEGEAQGDSVTEPRSLGDQLSLGGSKHEGDGSHAPLPRGLGRQGDLGTHHASTIEPPPRSLGNQITLGSGGLRGGTSGGIACDFSSGPGVPYCLWLGTNAGGAGLDEASRQCGSGGGTPLSTCPPGAFGRCTRELLGGLITQVSYFYPDGIAADDMQSVAASCENDSDAQWEWIEG